MGLGRRTFAPGEVLTASNVMNYLQDQVVMNFAGTAARGSAIGTAVQQGMVSYLADNNFVQVHDGTAWRSVGGVQVASGTATRDALLPSPIQGDRVFRTDLGYEETYYTAYGTANPGGRASAGWYGNQRNMGLVPIVPPTVNYSGGTATANTLGVISFTTATSISLNNIFTSSYKNYRVIFRAGGSSMGAAVYCRFRKAGTDNSSASFYWAGAYSRSSGAASANTWNGNGSSVMDITRLHTDITNQKSIAVIDILGPADGKTPMYTFAWAGEDSTSQVGGNGNGTFAISDTFDGLTFFTSGGNFTGQVQILAYNY